MPWFMVDMGVAAKGQGDCGCHEWYREDDDVWRCYHCKVGRNVGTDPFAADLLRELE